MPSGDGTGPVGMGPMTGRAAGFCSGYSVPGYANPVGGCGFFGRGRGGGFGRGRGFGWGMAGYGLPAYGGAVNPYAANAPFRPTITAEEELEGLKQEAEFLHNSLSQISERIEQLEKSKSE